MKNVRFSSPILLTNPLLYILLHLVLLNCYILETVVTAPKDHYLPGTSDHWLCIVRFKHWLKYTIDYSSCIDRVTEQKLRVDLLHQ